MDRWNFRKRARIILSLIFLKSFSVSTCVWCDCVLIFCHNMQTFFVIITETSQIGKSMGNVPFSVLLLVEKNQNKNKKQKGLNMIAKISQCFLRLREDSQCSVVFFNWFHRHFKKYCSSSYVVVHCTYVHGRQSFGDYDGVLYSDILLWHVQMGFIWKGNWNNNSSWVL